MRLFITALLLFQYFFSLGQVKKEDFEAIFKVTPFEKLSDVKISKKPNPDYNNSNDWAWVFYADSKHYSYKLKDNCIYFISYKENSKTDIERMQIIPYDKILRIDFDSDRLYLYLIN